MLTPGQFVMNSCQATIFTPDEEVSAAKLFTTIVPRWIATFDADPFVLPIPEAVPREIPRVILRSQSGDRVCEIASSRVNLHWRRTAADAAAPSLEAFYDSATAMLIEYRDAFRTRVGRLAAVITRYARDPEPGLTLARHFCQERWWRAPLNRPESFELHAHKRFPVDERFTVNSWVRSKTGKLSSPGEPAGDIVLLEQDLNTLAEEEAARDFANDELSTFFRRVGPEFDHILALYYPNGDAR